MAIRHDGMSDMNEYLVLEYLRAHRRTTRPQIADAVNLSQASVSRIISKLLAGGMVLETPGASESGGRPRGVLEVNDIRHCVIGVDLGGTKCHGVLADGDGEVLAERHGLVADAGSAYEALVDVWEALLAEARARDCEVRALGVGVPAVIDPASGLAVRGPNVQWEGFNIVERLREFGVPFRVDNDVNLAAVAEGREGWARGVRDYAVVSIGTGLGGAVVCDGKLVLGRNNAGGELATLLPSVDMVRQRCVGGIGGMETVLTGPAIAARAQALVELKPMAQAELGSKPTARTVIEHASRGGRYAMRIVADVIDALAMCVVTLAAVVDPEVVVVDGSVGRALAPFLSRVAERVALHIPTPPRIEVSTLGPNSTVRGAVAVALQLQRSIDVPDILATLLQDRAAQS
ncbi:ROK family transcriptional regulator [Paraburkholderia sp. HP33-1]|uniref:ROK family transcriptional regulator n=1 Tax=Paraburkholderia sp. HP33-1 TaxID=2883243 RepID=UPI001F3A6294|nr:ROK family transcriptional regulator [Paraburkholderia sp. HP33-1]